MIPKIPLRKTRNRAWVAIEKSENCKWQKTIDMEVDWRRLVWDNIPNMETRIVKAISAAVTTLLRPLVRILLRNGIPYRGVFRYREASLRGRGHGGIRYPWKETVEIPRLHSHPASPGKRLLRVRRLPASDDLGATERLQSGRSRDRRLGSVTDGSGKRVRESAETSIRGGVFSFRNLVKTYSGDSPTRGCSTNWLASRGRERTPGGKIRLLERSYIPKTGEIDKIGHSRVDAVRVGPDRDASTTQYRQPDHASSFPRGRSVTTTFPWRSSLN